MGSQVYRAAGVGATGWLAARGSLCLTDAQRDAQVRHNGESMAQPVIRALTMLLAVHCGCTEGSPGPGEKIETPSDAVEATVETIGTQPWFEYTYSGVHTSGSALVLVDSVLTRNGDSADFAARIRFGWSVQHKDEERLRVRLQDPRRNAQRGAPAKDRKQDGLPGHNHQVRPNRRPREGATTPSLRETRAVGSSGGGDALDSGKELHIRCALLA